MKYTIYQTTNKVNGKIYIGKHQTKNVNDTYLGSGLLLEAAIKKYGKENFIKEILYVFETEEEMNLKEKELVTYDFVKSKDTYNLGIGGEGGPHFKGKTHSNETKEKLAKLSSGRIPSKETRQKITDANKRRTVGPETKKKIAIKCHLRHGRTLEEAIKIVESNKIKKPKKSKSEAMKDYYSNPENRLKKSNQMKRLHLEYNFNEMKKDFDAGLTPNELRKKYNLTKNKYDHIRVTYLLDAV